MVLGALPCLLVALGTLSRRRLCHELRFIHGISQSGSWSRGGGILERGRSIRPGDPEFGSEDGGIDSREISRRIF